MQRLACIIATVVAGLLWLALAESLRAADPVKLREVPAKEARDKILALVKDVHKKEYLEAKSDAQLSAFAATLLKEGRETRDDDVARFVLFAESLAQATKANDWNGAFAAIDQMGSEFKIDAFEQKARAASEIGKKLTVPAKKLEFLPTVGELALQAIAKDKYEIATDLGATGTLLARGGSTELVARAKAGNDRIAELKSAYAGVEKVLPILDSKANDPQANLVYGSFYFFIKGDLERGVTALALCSDPALRDVAITDIQQPDTADKQVALGDAWWAIAEQRTTAMEKQNAKTRASFWYEKALPGLAGLTKTRVERRIDESKSRGDLAHKSISASTRVVSLKLGDLIENTVGMKLAYIPAGRFTMGSPASEKGHESNEAQVEVTLTKSFYLETTVVTQGQWKQLMKTEPWKGREHIKEGPNFPATFVNWDDARDFCQALSTKEGKKYRLPTEAEWEYGCRAGTKTAYYFGQDASRLGEYSWFGGLVGDGNAKTEPFAHEVAQKRPNGFGLYDMNGNVWQWCEDSYGEKLPGGVDPLVSTPGAALRVPRGGGWHGYAVYCRSAYRGMLAPVDRFEYLGFRVALTVDDK